MGYIELEKKRDYVNNLRELSVEELEDLKEYILKMNVKPEALEKEVLGIKLAYSNMDYIMREESSFPYPPNYTHPLTEDFLKSINRAVIEYYSCFLSYEKGSYRVGCNDKIGDELLPSSDIFIPRLKEIIKWYSTSDLDIFRKSSIFHMSFLKYVHPFYDGNGRTARAFLNLELARRGYPMIGLKYSDIRKYEYAFTLSVFDGYDFIEKLIVDNVDAELERLKLIKTSF